MDEHMKSKNSENEDSWSSRSLAQQEDSVVEMIDTTKKAST